MCTNFHFENEETKAQSNAPKETADLKPRGPWSWRFLGSQAGRWGVIGGVVLGVSTTCDSRLCPDLRTQSVQGPPSSVLEAQPAGSLHRGPPSTAPDDTRPSHPSRNMSSLFSRDTKSLVRELGRKDELVPVTSLASALRLRLFCLVRKKHRHHLCPWDTLIATDFSLMDALEPGSPIPGTFRRGWQAAEQRGQIPWLRKLTPATQAHRGHPPTPGLPGLEPRRGHPKHHAPSVSGKEEPFSSSCPRCVISNRHNTFRCHSGWHG